MPPSFYTYSRRTRIELSKEIGRGGEGAVYSVQDNDGIVAKIYNTRPSDKKIKKLLIMISMKSAALQEIAAWPIDAIVDEHGGFVGIIMQKILSRSQIHKLYTPSDRNRYFPRADYRFVVHVCCNIARAIAIIHSQKQVIGDINCGNLLVANDGTVMLIDCDSFQIQDGGEIFTCDVGSELYLPPELQNRPLDGLIRVTDHDRFGLAVLLYQLLFMGWHPYAGASSRSGDASIGCAIAEGLFGQVWRSARTSPKRIIADTCKGIIGADCFNLFSRAFNTTGKERPFPEEWIRQLDALKDSLMQCTSNAQHAYKQNTGACPWCRLSAHGIQLFKPVIGAGLDVNEDDLEDLMAEINALKHPGPAPQISFKKEKETLRKMPLPRVKYSMERSIAFALLVIIFPIVLYEYRASFAWIIPIVFFSAIFLTPRHSPHFIYKCKRNLEASMSKFKYVSKLWWAHSSASKYNALLAKARQEYSRFRAYMNANRNMSSDERRSRKEQMKRALSDYHRQLHTMAREIEEYRVKKFSEYEKAFIELRKNTLIFEEVQKTKWFQ